MGRAKKQTTNKQTGQPVYRSVIPLGARSSAWISNKILQGCRTTWQMPRPDSVLTHLELAGHAFLHEPVAAAGTIAAAVKVALEHLIGVAVVESSSFPAVVAPIT